MVSSVSGLSSSPSGSMNITMPMTIKVLDVKSGVSTLQFSMGQPSATSPGKKPMKVPMEGAGTDITVSVDNRNRPVGYSSQQLVGTTFPIKKIKIGETWKATAPMTQTAPVQADMICKFLGMTTISGHKVAKIATTVTGNAKGTGMLYLRAADGSIDSLNLKLSVGNTSQALKMNVKLVRKA